MGIGGPTTPFPASIPEFIVPLPLPVEPREGPAISEMSCVFTKVNERGYAADGYDMFAAAYEGVTTLGTIQGALITNALSEKVTMAVALIVNALARYYALKWSYEGQRPPLPLPPNPGIGSPFSSEVIATLDGTARFRGFCAGIHSLDPALVATVEVGFSPAWAKEKPPQ